jgi:hypothetical protein
VVEKVANVEITFFITVEGESRAVQEGSPTTVVRIQCFSFGSKVEATGWSFARRWNIASELVLAPWKANMTRCGGVAMSIGEEAAPGREKGGDDVSWTDTDLAGRKIKKIYMVNSAATNDWWRFKIIINYYFLNICKWDLVHLIT